MNSEKNLGIAFQLHDDLLDVYGDSEKFGKQVGGDILANKKTFLLLTALQRAEGNIKSELNKWISSTDYSQNKIDAIISIYEKLDVKDQTTLKMDYFFKKALDELEAVSGPENRKSELLNLAEKLMIREK